jgi:hypothetical protein
MERKIHNIIMEMGNKGRMKWSERKVRDGGTKIMLSK